MKIINYKNLDQIFIIKNFFTDKELHSIFDLAKTNDTRFYFGNFGRIIPSLFTEHPSYLNKLKIKYLVKNLSIFFKFKCMYTLHSDYHIDTFGNWHNDCGPNNSYLPRNFYSNNRFSDIFKVGIFNQIGCQSPTQFKIGNEILNVPLDSGDVLIFRIELTHRSRKIIKYLKVLNPFIYIKAFFKSPSNDSRMAIFFTIGRQGRVLDFFYLNNRVREKNQLANSWKI